MSQQQVYILVWLPALFVTFQGDTRLLIFSMLENYMGAEVS